MHKFPFVFFLCCVTALILLTPHLALAATAVKNAGCFAGDKTLNNIFCGIVTQFSSLPKLISIFSWVVAVILAIMALYNLKEYGDDPSSVPVKAIVVKLVIALMLVSLPFIMTVFINTLTGSTVSSGKIKSSIGAKMSLGGGKIGGV